MMEGIGWAGINEVPLVITLYQRAGPSTGMPTRHEQGDLRFALHAGHGDSPRIILASGDFEEAFHDGAKAFNWAERYQTTVIHLVDKALANSNGTMPVFDPDRVKIDREELDLAEVARDVIARLAELATRSRSEVALHCPEPIRGSWDRLALERVLGNLLSNALKFGAQKPVEIRVRSQGEQALIEIQDHGIGIGPEDVDRIFDQFERAVSSRHFGGLGLGLYITRQLVEEHGGTISVASTPGAGSTFTVRLPRTPLGSELPT